MSMYALNCKECNMTFTSQSKLWKHKEKFCIALGGSLSSSQQFLPNHHDQEYAEWGSREPPPPDDQYDSIVEEEKAILSKLNTSKVSKTDYKPQDYTHFTPYPDEPWDVVEGHSRKMEHLQSRNAELEAQKADIRSRLEELSRQPAGRSSSAQLLNKDQEIHNQQILADLKQHVGEIDHLEELSQQLLRAVVAMKTRGILVQKKPDLPHMDNIIQSIENTNQTFVHKLMNDNSKEKADNKLPLIERNMEQHVCCTGRGGISASSGSNGQIVCSKQDEGRKSRINPYPMYYGNSLVAEISAVRQNYIQQGGTDPVVLAQMAKMIADAHALEDKNKLAKESIQAPQSTDSSHKIQALEMENQRLQRELLLLQTQNVKQATPKGKEKYKDVFDHDLQSLQMEHLKKLTELQHEMELMRHQVELERFRNDMAVVSQRAVQKQESPDIKHESQSYASMRNSAEVPLLLHSKHHIPMDYSDSLIATGPYDAIAGFVIFYDFILGLDVQVQSCRLIVGLHGSQDMMGDATVLPATYTNPITSGSFQSVNRALIGAKQPVPKCPAHQSLSVIAELQLSGSGLHADAHRLVTRAWLQVKLFDQYGQLVTGRFRVPFHVLPIQSHIQASDMSTVPKFGSAELFVRVSHYRDAHAQSLSPINIENAQLYAYPMSPAASYPVFANSSQRLPPPSLTASPGTPLFASPQRRSPSPLEPGTERTVGFQVDRVKYAEPGEAKIRITAYYVNNGKVVQSHTGPLSSSTTVVKSTFRYRYHVYGQQEAVFDGVDLQSDIILIIRLYMISQKPAAKIKPKRGDDVENDENYELKAWSALPLLLRRKHTTDPYGPDDFEQQWYRILTGTHILKLYQPPIPEPNRIPLQSNHPRHSDWLRYGKATIKLHIFQGAPRAGSITPSDMSDTGEEDLPEDTWFPLERRVLPSEPFVTGDGFDLYIDGCRFLPDSVSFNRIAARILDRKYEVYGKDVVTGVNIDSDIYNPVYEYREEVRVPRLSPTATLLMKVYTVDVSNKELTVVGYSALALFLESGTEKQPAADSGIQISLNEGSHQLRLYQSGPNGLDPLTEDCLKDGYSRHIPCASVLVRIAKAAKGSDGKPLEKSKVPESDWKRLGLLQSMPKYTDRVYYSLKCRPTDGEVPLYHAVKSRAVITMRQAVMKAQGREGVVRNDRSVEQYIRSRLTRTMSSKPLDQNINHISKYSPVHGIKVSVDKAVNLPWSNFTMAHICLNPPAAFYVGTPNMMYDRLVFARFLDTTSTDFSPSWTDGFNHFPFRSYHEHLTVVIHLQEIGVTVTEDNYKYGLLKQAWTIVPVFTEHYACTELFQVPLFMGAPNADILRQLAREPCTQWLANAVQENQVQLVDGASIMVRLADARRDDELYRDNAGHYKINVNTSLLPVSLLETYQQVKEGKPLKTLVPEGKSPVQFISGLADKFKTLVYKLYEEGEMTSSETANVEEPGT